MGCYKKNAIKQLHIGVFNNLDALFGKLYALINVVEDGFNVRGA